MLKKLILPTILTCSAALIVWYIPPVNIFIISGWTFFVVFAFYFFSATFFGRKLGVAVAIFVFLFISITYLIGFDFLSMILLTSLLIAVLLLIK